MHSTINYLIYISCLYITKNYIVLNANLKFTEMFNLLQSFSFHSQHLQTHRSLRVDKILSSLSAMLVYCVFVSNSVYNLLLLFIGKLEIVSTWIYRLSIKYCNNYLPTNLASEINSIGLHCRNLDSSTDKIWTIHRVGGYGSVNLCFVHIATRF